MKPRSRVHRDDSPSVQEVCREIAESLKAMVRRGVGPEAETTGGRHGLTIVELAARSSVSCFSSEEAYTLEQIGARLNRPREWVYNTFIRPVDHRTKRRLLNADGRPIPGVFHFKMGASCVVPGKTLIAWIMEQGGRMED